MKVESVQPPGWPRPSGYSNGIIVTGAGKLVFVAGQIAWDARRELVGPGDFAAQFEQALRNVVAVVEAAGGKPEHIARMTIYVTDKRLYSARTAEIGAAWRAILGKHFPAVALVQVADLLEAGALVEIEAVAALSLLA
jgi:enamine deaminase RidA (YjgF/YER057c/UK114 family)